MNELSKVNSKIQKLLEKSPLKNPKNGENAKLT